MISKEEIEFLKGTFSWFIICFYRNGKVLRIKPKQESFNKSKKQKVFIFNLIF